MLIYKANSIIDKSLLSLTGVSVKGELVEFDPEKGWTEKRAEAYLKTGGRKAFSKSEYSSKAYKPTEEDFMRVRAIVNDDSVDVQKEFFFRELLLMNSSVVDRQYDLATDEALKALAQSINKENTRLNTQHNRESATLGKSFHAYLKDVNGVTWLAVRFYGPKALLLPGQTQYTVEDAIRHKMLDQVSIGFMGLDSTYNKDIEAWYLEPKEGHEVMVYEISFVDLGAVPDARIEKSAIKPNTNIKPKPKKMDFKKSFAVGDFTGRIEVNVDGEAATFNTASLEAGIKNLIDKADDANTKATELQKEIDDAKAPLIESIEAKQKAMNTPEALALTADELKGKSLAKVSAIEAELQTQWAKANPSGQVVDPITGS